MQITHFCCSIPVFDTPTQLDQLEVAAVEVINNSDTPNI